MGQIPSGGFVRLLLNPQVVNLSSRFQEVLENLAILRRQREALFVKHR